MTTYIKNLLWLTRHYLTCPYKRDCYLCNAIAYDMGPSPWPFYVYMAIIFFDIALVSGR